MTRSRLPLLDADEIVGDRSDVTVHGVLLAAGTSSRYGDANKLLATVDGEPIVRNATRTLVRSNCDGVTVVLGYEAEGVRAVLADLDVSTTVNDAYDHGQSSSVRRGAHIARDRNADAVLVALGDMPAVSVDSVDALIDAYAHDEGDAIAAAYDGKRGNPVLFDAQYFDALTDVSGDVGGREILRTADDGILVETGDPGVRYDVDRPQDH